MPEIDSYTFNYKEVVEALIKLHGLREGIWQLTAEFGIGAANIGAGMDDLKPAAIVPLIKLGLKKVDKENNLSVDAAKVNSP